MNFEDVLPALKNGKSIAREAWKDSPKWIYSDNGHFYFAKSNGSEGVWITTSADLLAEDWKVLNADGVTLPAESEIHGL